MSARLPAAGGDARLANIDALRGLAALLVVWLHTSEVFVRLPAVAAHGTGFADAAEFLQIGRAGVVAFFAISGFVITPTLKPPRNAGTRAFLIKRFFRLYPPFWLALCLSYLCIWLPEGRTPGIGGVLANATMVPTWFGQPAAVGHFWTLEIELIFYLLVVFLFWNGWLHRRGVLLALIVLLFPQVTAVLAAKLASDPGGFQSHWGIVPYSLAVMLWASLLREGYDANAGWSDTLKHWLRDPVVLIATLLVIGRAAFPGKFWVNGLADYFAHRGTLWGLLLFIAFAAARFPWPRAIVWTGTVSYSVYLLHPVVFYPLYYWVASHDQSLARLPVIAYAAATTVLVLALSSLTYVALERPCNELARRIVRRLR